MTNMKNETYYDLIQATIRSLAHQYDMTYFRFARRVFELSEFSKGFYSPQQIFNMLVDCKTEPFKSMKVKEVKKYDSC